MTPPRRSPSPISRTWRRPALSKTSSATRSRNPRPPTRPRMLPRAASVAALDPASHRLHEAAHDRRNGRHRPAHVPTIPTHCLVASLALSRFVRESRLPTAEPAISIPICSACALPASKLFCCRAEPAKSDVSLEGRGKGLRTRQKFRKRTRPETPGFMQKESSCRSLHSQIASRGKRHLLGVASLLMGHAMLGGMCRVRAHRGRAPGPPQVVVTHAAAPGGGRRAGPRGRRRRQRPGGCRSFGGAD